MPNAINRVLRTGFQFTLHHSKTEIRPAHRKLHVRHVIGASGNRISHGDVNCKGGWVVDAGLAPALPLLGVQGRGKPCTYRMKIVANVQPIINAELLLVRVQIHRASPQHHLNATMETKQPIRAVVLNPLS